VAPVALPETLGFEVLAFRGSDHFAGQQLLYQVMRAPLGRVAGTRRAAILPVNAGDAPAQFRELFLSILHLLRFFFA
jgi:hypothetical protein